MSVVTKAFKAGSYLMEHGAIETLKLARYRLSERYHEYRLGIRTNGFVPELKEFGFESSDLVDYSPAPYAAFLTAMHRISVNESDVFVDYGCGLGRIVSVAAQYPFKKIIGVDLVQEFVVIAQENVDRASKVSRCQDIELLVANALHYELPGDANVIHFYNPFRGETLEQVVAGLKRSLLSSPRTVTLLFANPDDFERVTSNETWIQSVGKDIPFPLRSNADEPGRNCYRIYMCTLPCSSL